VRTAFSSLAGFVALAALFASSKVERVAPEPRSEWGRPAGPAPTAKSANSERPTPRPVVLRDGMLDAPLFAEELAKVRAAVVRALEANEALPVEVLSASRLATLHAVAKAGKLREGGKKCAVAPTEDDVILAAHPKVLSGTFSLPCLGARCNLDVAVVPFEFGTRQFGTAPLLEAGGTPSDPTSVPSWEQTIASDDNEPRAGKATTGGGVGLGARGGLLGEFSFHVRGAFGFAKTPTDESFAGVVAKAKECGTKTAGQLLLAVDAKGKVTRCEAESPCLCRVFSKQTFDAGAEGRRLVAFVQEAGELGGSPGAVGWGSAGLLPGPNGPRVRPSSKQRVRRRSDGNERPRERALSACFGKEGARATFELHSTLDETGRVTAARLDESDLTEEQSTCVLGVAKTLGYRCPDAAGDVVQVRYDVVAR
jgi:hypothetical protein